MNSQIIVSIILGVFASLIAGANFYMNWRLAKDKLNKELFTEFNARYDKLNDTLYEIVEKCKTIEDLQAQPLLIYRLNDYFNLCAEEYYWYNKGRIDKLIWKAWHSGMNHWYQSYRIIQQAWDLEIQKNGCKSFYIKESNEFF